MYLRPRACAQALEMLADRRCTVLAGATDIYPAHVGRQITGDILDISALADLRPITEEDHSWRIGALATWTSIAAAHLPPSFRGLQQAALQIGGVQIQNTATIGGNLCNASPAADGTPNLVALDAEVELSSTRGTRRMPVASFIVGNRKTQLAPDELLTAIIVPKRNRSTRSTFLKLGARKYLVISIASVSVTLEFDGSTISETRIAVGSCSPAPCRLQAAEAALKGQPRKSGTENVFEPGMLDALSPIDDVRGTAVYRRDAVLTMIRRAVRELTA